MNTQQIIKGCKANDRKAQNALYHLLADNLMNICYRYSLDISEAKDVLQNTFIKIFTKIDQFDEAKGEIKSWCSRIAVNEALMNKRRRAKYLFKEDTEMQVVHDSMEEPAVYQELGKEEITKIINTLPEGYRVIFNLSVVEGYNHKEIAEMLEISEGTSRSQLQRARKAIQKVLKKNTSKVA